MRPRTFPGQDELAGVHVVRTLDDALALRAELRPSVRLVVAGDGVLGAEIAAPHEGWGRRSRWSGRSLRHWTVSSARPPRSCSPACTANTGSACAGSRWRTSRSPARSSAPARA
ncbi:hypothetical protein [Nonomuraea diastatica]|uniref:hypothetical protein n=1 Tax=Nonomuraea diastatica TaxID=1848329 RepID=UPI001FE35066|nr:hypothetical protein [Nonomuraea diastatica]